MGDCPDLPVYAGLAGMITGSAALSGEALAWRGIVEYLPALVRICDTPMARSTGTDSAT